jgi:acetyl esterase/lipase
MRPYFVLALLWVFQLGMAQNNCSSRRYIDRVFNNVTVQRDIKYGRATTWTGADKDMLLDLFSPANDTIPYRPVIIWAHSGAFIDAINDKGVPDMQAFADSFAHKGYVTMSIDYRCGYIGLQTQVERAVYRALQDGKAVVRFLKANYQVYGIDTNNIFFAGSSAGAITALLTA